ncbi:endoplasmic reticulum oxidoreductin-1-like isoform X1 [Prunus dulcis]|uniref:endoplasmic reticulum oxidoreductin-1-like isoform X1 n=1 Tax=Prunus dulcis TaxID=3755 RepID=UPI001483AEE3|nr:endoplasmic reticulum oxidoreductin-1-like isoform X1 [Prunus dulcis]
MNNFKEVLVALEMVKKKEKNEKKSKRWAAFLGAVVVVLLATALTSTRTASKFNLSLFFKNPNSCHCPQDSKGYTGIVEDCCCDYETVDSVNAEVLRGALFYKRLLKFHFSDISRSLLLCPLIYFMLLNISFWMLVILIFQSKHPRD